MRNSFYYCFALLVLVNIGSAEEALTASSVPIHPEGWVPPILSPEDELKTFHLPAGYHMELVLSEPIIKEPVWASFDANGRMYVVEMRSYMQDADGSNEFAPISRVSRHESSKEDGVYDKHTVFVDHMVLPRTVLPLDKGKVLIGRTNTNDLTLYKDSKDLGVADSNELYYSGGPYTGNLEHQPSGLIWSLDNWIYTTYNSYRLRWRENASMLREPTANNGGQWGLTQDDLGKLWFSTAGGEKLFLHFQTHILYAAVNSSKQWDPNFPSVFPLVGLADVQGGKDRFRPEDKTLNHATAIAGQEVYRGDRLPAELKGNIFIGEPVGRLVRRATIEVKDGITVVSNPYQKEHSEFLRSSDPYFRPIQITNAPDGCLYIVDMYRGIIQEGNWVKADSYLRPVVVGHSLQKSIGHGRIWRLVYDGIKPSTPLRLFDMNTAELVAQLSSPNGWIRDNAQKLLVLRQDKSAAPILRTTALSSGDFYGRLHALWTLEGLNLVDVSMIDTLLADPDAKIRATAIRVAESISQSGSISLKPRILALFNDSDPTVALQAMMSARQLKWSEWSTLAKPIIATTKSEGIKEIGSELLKPADRFEIKKRTAQQVAQLRQGQAIYDSLCFACHGSDGRGVAIGDKGDMKLAPSLVNSRIVMGPPQQITQVLLHGLSGPDGNKTYPGQMIAMAENSDEWIAAVVSFVRTSLAGNSMPSDGSFGYHTLPKKNAPGGDSVSASEVKLWRALYASKKEPWTREELTNAILPERLNNSNMWRVCVGNQKETVNTGLTFDESGNIKFNSGVPQSSGYWFQVELPDETTIAGVRLDAGENVGSFPRAYRIEASLDGKNWDKTLVASRGNGILTWAHFNPIKARFIRITLTGAGSDGWSWAISHMDIFKSYNAKKESQFSKNSTSTSSGVRFAKD
jgi:mono/diheme cytochrome c family protein